MALALLIGVLSLSIALGWDPDDETFDPEVKYVIADNAARLGDPSPVYLEGVETRGFTYVAASINPEGQSLVQLSFIVTPPSGNPATHPIGAMFLPLEGASALADLLEQGPSLEGSPEAHDGEGMGKWTISWDGEAFLRLTNDHAKQGGTFLLSAPAGKKLAGALRHSVKIATDAEGG
ncbi:MAG: hypothetical protein AAGA96_10520 [Verrucomicrobiota bacterium]